MNWHAEKSNASVISLRIWYQQHFSVLSEFIERCSLASSLLVGKTFHLYAGFLIGFWDVITGFCVIAVLCIENRENICMRAKWPEQTQNWRNGLTCNIRWEVLPFPTSSEKLKPNSVPTFTYMVVQGLQVISKTYLWSWSDIKETADWETRDVQPLLQAGDDI